MATFFENFVSLAQCKQMLIAIADSYSESSKQHDREWESAEERRLW